MRFAIKRSALLALLLLVSCSVRRAGATDDKSDAGLLSEAGPTFKLAAPKGDWTLIAYGDMRFTDPANTKVTNPTARRALVARIAEERPDALLLSGDVPYSGDVANDYVVFQQESAPWRAAGLKVFPAMGNHELHGGRSLENWWDAFPELKGRRWYSVQFGESYVLTVDSNLDLVPGSRQAQWLAQQLDALPRETRYVFVSLHHPPLADPIPGNPSHSGRPNEEALARQLEAAAAKIKAKIVVIAGHVHTYERFERGGVIYLVSGGGGAAQHEVERIPADLFQNKIFPNYHYVKFVSHNGELKATMYRLNDKGGYDALDSFAVGGGKK
jgi:hypothetical protein